MIYDNTQTAVMFVNSYENGFKLDTKQYTD